MTTLEKEAVSVWKGSLKNAAIVRQCIAERYGQAAAENYDPEGNCFTFQGWRERGYHVKKGERSIRVSTWLMRSEIRTDETGKEVEKFYSIPRTAYLFYIDQVEKNQGGEKSKPREIRGSDTVGS